MLRIIRGALALTAVAIALHYLPPAPAVAQDRTGWPKTLRVSAIPDVNQNQLLVTYRPFADYLAKRLGIAVEFIPVTDYAATVDGLASKRLELVWYGGYTSVQAVRATDGNAERLVMRAEDKKFKSVFVTHPGSGVKSLADLKGKTFSFGSQSSTSGHLMPRYFLMVNGIEPDKDFKKLNYSGAHDATAKAVEGAVVDAGVLNFLTWASMVEDAKVDTNKVRVFWTTPEYVDYCWVARKDLPASLRDAIREAFLSLDPADPADKALLDLHNASRYVAATDADWKGTEDAARAAGMLQD